MKRNFPKLSGSIASIKVSGKQSSKQVFPRIRASGCLKRGIGKQERRLDVLKICPSVIKGELGGRNVI